MSKFNFTKESLRKDQFGESKTEKMKKEDFIVALPPKAEVRDNKFVVEGKEYPMTFHNLAAIQQDKLERLSEIVLDFGEAKDERDE